MKDLYRILSGQTIINENGLTVIVGPFSFFDHYQAEIFAEEKYNQAFLEGHFTESETQDLLVEMGLWTEDDENNLQQIPKNIDQMKIDYFNLFYRDCISYIRDNIRFQEKRFSEILEKKNYLFKSTCESIRDQAKTFWLIENCSKINGQPIDLNKVPLMSLVAKFSDQMLSSEEIRGIAKSNMFRSMWSTNKDEIRSGHISEMKTVLIHWSMVYDNVYESPDCPEDSIIMDDLALDGWFLLQRRKREEERKKNAKDNVSDRMSKAGEVFLPASSMAEVQKIYNMNSEEARRKLNLLNKDLKNNSSIDDIKLSSNMEAIGIAKNKAQFERKR